MVQGNLYAWVADSGETTPEEFKGTSSEWHRRFVKIDHYDADFAGQPGYDSLGFGSMAEQDAATELVLCGFLAQRALPVTRRKEPRF